MEFRKFNEDKQGFKIVEIKDGIPFAINDQKIEKVFADLINIMNDSQCKNVDFGSYDCYEQTMFGISVDKCLIDEINQLNNLGIKTIGCCCGHDKEQGYIQVVPQDVSKMIELKYEQRPIDQYGNGKWCFIPKTILPY